MLGILNDEELAIDRSKFREAVVVVKDLSGLY